MCLDILDFDFLFLGCQHLAKDIVNCISVSALCYHVRYQKSKDQDAYLRRHETELLLHDGAENMLKRFGIDLKNLDVEKLRSDYNALYCIFRKNRALAPHERSAVPLGTDHCPVG